MGDRICLTIVNEEDGERSPTLYAHWAGMDLITDAQEFYRYCKEQHLRDEPSNMMVNFIIWLGLDVRDGGFYLYRNEDEASCPDDNGFWELDATTGIVKQV